MLILALETSCDETSIALLRTGQEVITNTTHSQIKNYIHLGGVIPELASREHSKNIIPVLDKTLRKSRISLHEIDALAVAVKPGLPGSLLVGLTAAKTLAYLLHKPLIEVDHLIGHLYSTWLYKKPQLKPNFTFPLLYLTASGGHTSLILMHNHQVFQTLGKTLDDAAGEAFDKVAFLLGGPYPGGPFIAKLAQGGNPQAIAFPRGMIKHENFNFSFSGLKTAVYTFLKKQNQQAPPVSKKDIAASFQEAVVDSLLVKLNKAVQLYKPQHIMLAGGVSANARLRKKARMLFGKKLVYPQLRWCTDNAAMIGCAAYFSLP